MKHAFELDPTKRANKLKSILFTVKELQVYVDLDNKLNLFNDTQEDRLLQAENYKAIVNIDTKVILSIVSRNYVLITNEDAIKLGKEAFRQLFPSINSEDLIPYKIISSLRNTFCYIDILHKDISFKTMDQATWFPFIRITNSYNRTKKLKFEIGFVKKLCSNGIIFNSKTVTIEHAHSGKNFLPKVTSDLTELKILEADFINYMNNLQRFYIKKDLAFPLLLKVLKLDYKLEEPKNLLEESRQRMFLDLKLKTNSLVTGYIPEMGETAYAMLNVLTDIVSHQEEYNNLPMYSTRVNDYYYRISNWVVDFTELAEKRDFRIDNYLKDYIKYIN